MLIYVQECGYECLKTFVAFAFLQRDSPLREMEGCIMNLYIHVTTEKEATPKDRLSELGSRWRISPIWSKFKFRLVLVRSLRERKFGGLAS